MSSSNPHITRDNLEAIIADRSRIVRNYIDSADMFEITAIVTFARMVFFEVGWDYRVEPVIGRKPEFYVRTYDPEA